MPEDYRYQQYKVLRREDGSLWELGRGAMGITYKAFDTNLRCQVALKVINNSSLNSELARQRFLREARAAAALRHPNIASLFALGTDDHGNYFCAMEFIDGLTVEARVKRQGPLEPVEALNIGLLLQRDILACLEEIRLSPFQSAHRVEETTSAFRTLDLTSTSSQPLGIGAVLAQNYKLIEELPETPQGRNFLADDLRRRRQVRVLPAERGISIGSETLHGS